MQKFCRVKVFNTGEVVEWIDSVEGRMKSIPITEVALTAQNVSGTKGESYVRHITTLYLHTEECEKATLIPKPGTPYVRNEESIENKLRELLEHLGVQFE